jgi:MFS family permease
MAPVYATEAGLTLGQLSIFVSSFFIGAIVLQYPIGWLSDRMDRRILIVGASGLGSAVAPRRDRARRPYLPGAAGGRLLSGGLAQPLYALLIAYTNDYLEVRGHARRLGGADVRERDRRDRRPAGDGRS